MTPLEIVKKYNEVCWHGKQPDLAADILADKVVRNYVGKTEILTREESVQRIRDGLERAPDLSFTFHDFIDGGDKITIIWEASSDIYQHEGENLISAGIEVFRVEDGKICEVWNAEYAFGSRWHP